MEITDLILRDCEIPYVGPGAFFVPCGPDGNYRPDLKGLRLPGRVADQFQHLEGWKLPT